MCLIWHNHRGQEGAGLVGLKGEELECSGINGEYYNGKDRMGWGVRGRWGSVGRDNQP